MKSSLIITTAVALALCTFVAQAKLPLINATCPGQLDVHVDQGGPVFVNGKEATLKVFNENYYEAKDAATGTTVSISINPDGSPDVSYTGKNRANGVCTLASDAAAASAAVAAPADAARESNPASEKACLAAVSKQVGVASTRLSVIGSEFSQAGTSVSVSVPGADAPWACMTDQKGKVWNVSYTGSEGKL